MNFMQFKNKIWYYVKWNANKKLNGHIYIYIRFTYMYMYCYFQVHKIYRSTGASFDKAKQEFSTGVMKNEAVQNVAANAAQGAVKGMASQYGSNNKYWRVTVTLA